MEIPVTEFAQIEEHAFILDVREGWELKKATLKNVVHCPLSELTSAIESFPQDQTIYVLCHHGIRSLKAALYLESRGLKALSIRGGIDAYAREVDASVGFY